MWETPITVPGFRPTDDDLQRCRRETVPAGVPLHVVTPVPREAADDDQPEPLPPPPLPPAPLSPPLSSAPIIPLDVLRAALAEGDSDERPTRPLPVLAIDALADTVDLPASPRPARPMGWADITSAVQLLALRAIELPIGAGMLQRDSCLRRRRIIQVVLTALVLIAVPWETRSRAVPPPSSAPVVEALARPAPPSTCVARPAAPPPKPAHATARPHRR